MSAQPIFYDPTGRRRRYLSRLSWIAAITIPFIVAAFLATLLITDTPRGAEPLASNAAATHSRTKAARDVALDGNIGAKLRDQERAAARWANLRRQRPWLQDQHLPLVAQGRAPLIIGFYVNWDDNSYPALQASLARLDWVVPAWLSLQGPDMALTADVDQKALDLILRTKPKTAIFPLIRNAVDDNWDGDGLARLLADRSRRTDRIREIVTFLELYQLQGVTIDFEEIPSRAHKHLQAFLSELRSVFAARGWVVVLAVPFDDDDWDYQEYAKLADYLILMAYDEHWEEGNPGSIASQKWFDTTLGARMKALDPAHTIIAIGSYGYDWEADKTAEDNSFQEAVLQAHDSQVDIDFDRGTANPHFSYVDDGGRGHEVWFLDAVTAFNEIHLADHYRPAGYGLWRLGSEDPSIWSVLGRPYGAPAPDELRNIAPGQDIDIDGSGEILRVETTPRPGERAIEVDPKNGIIVREIYQVVPTPYVIRRFGGVAGKVSLTFDDGPDPVWTPKILDILASEHVTVTFFIIGEHAQAYPYLIHRMIDEGHEVGNHTYTHPNIAQIPPVFTRLELNTTQRLFEALTGRSLRLFRPPYLGDAEPTTNDEVEPIDLAQSMGYLTVGLHLDPSDWQRPPAEEIVSRVLKQIADPDPDVGGNIILLHDAGGDRSQTIIALPRLIDELRRRGYQFVSASALAGLTRDQAMPPLQTQSLPMLVDGPVFFSLRLLDTLLFAVFLLAIWLGLARLIFLCTFALVNARSHASAQDRERPKHPLLHSVLIPAYNEAKVIGESIDHVLASDHPDLEVIVIDDGSNDDTFEVVRARFGADSRVRLIRTENGGKARALNLALRCARGAVVVALDADTQFRRDTISRLARWFVDDSVGAVAGNAKVGNRVNFFTYCQALEYITAQNLERRALAALGCITVVPGAVGAWRKETLDRVGGFPVDTIAEDQDLTIAVQKAGYRVVFDADAIAYTEAPDTLAGLAKQRFRWAFGTLQCLWKHRDVTFRLRYGALGLVAFPQVWLFQILFAIIAPLVDLALVWQLIATGIDYFNHGDQFDASNLGRIALYYGAFILADILAAVVGFAIEKRERWSLLWWLVIQRYGYRQLVYYVVLRATLVAIAGPVVRWGKLERKANVSPLGT